MRFAAAGLAALLLAASASGQSLSDLAREKRWAEQVQTSLVVGDAIQLEAAGGIRFLALYAEAKPAKGAVLLVHGPGLHPDHGITGELRVRLTDRGYTTLSLQMPVAPAEDDDPQAYVRLFPEAVQRIEAGMRYLQEKGVKRAAIVSHAMGSAMSFAYLRRRLAEAPVAAWVSMSFYGAFPGIAGAPFPVFDLYGASDYRGIRGAADERARVLASMRGSKQLEVEDGGRFLAGGEATVLREVPAFLDTVIR